MPNETQIECFFKSSELAKLCQGCKDVVVKFKATYTEGKIPTFEISASSYKKGAKSGKGLKAMPLQDGTDGSIPGCPTPCK
ncbi:MAG TPA: hypothetical protein VIJ92_07840 [Ginsengibacter sp.]